MKRFKLTAKDNVKVVKRVQNIGEYMAREMISKSPEFEDEMYRRTKDLDEDSDDFDDQVDKALDEVFDEIWTRLDSGKTVDVGDYYLEKESEHENS